MSFINSANSKCLFNCKELKSAGCTTNSNTIFFQSRQNKGVNEDRLEVSGNTQKSKMGVIAKIMAFLTLLLSCLGLHFTRKCETKALFNPDRTNIEPLREHLKDKLDAVSVKTSDNILLSSWYIRPQKGKPTVLFCHGNAANISLKQDIAESLLKEGFGGLLLEYRGYGGNPGVPSEKGLYKDVDGALKYLHSKGVENRDIIVWGHSLGGAVAAEIASKYHFKAVILESTFTNARDISKHCINSRLVDSDHKAHKAIIKAARYIPKQLLPIKSKFNTDQKVSKIAAPLLIVHSKEDELIPVSMAELQAQKNPDARLILSETGCHGDHSWSIDTIIDFIKEVTQDS
ncbi:MAG: alpha/beta hydrolase [Cyanobacteriota bacterium]